MRESRNDWLAVSSVEDELAGSLVIIQMSTDGGLNCRLKTYLGIRIHGLAGGEGGGVRDDPRFLTEAAGVVGGALAQGRA